MANNSKNTSFLGRIKKLLFKKENKMEESTLQNFPKVTSKINFDDIKPKESVIIGSAGNNNNLNADQLIFLDAIKKGNMDKISALASKHGFRVNFTDETGNKPLHYAVETANIPVIELLIKKHARLDDQNKEGRTPLLVAAYKTTLYSESDAMFVKYVNIMDILIKSGSEPKIRDNKGKRFIDYLNTRLIDRFSRMTGIRC